LPKRHDHPDLRTVPFALGYLRDNPGKLLELAGLLGHESLDTTVVYTRPSRDDLAADLERSHLNVGG
jgi:site-specific recombinase XerC